MSVVCVVRLCGCVDLVALPSECAVMVTYIGMRPNRVTPASQLLNMLL